MNTRFIARRRAALLASACLGLAACGGSPALRYFSLQGPATTTCPAQGNAGPSVQVLKLSVPEMLDRPQLVFRSGDNTLVLEEGARWAESLKSAIGRVLATEISQALGCAPVLLQPLGTEGTDWSLSVEIQRLEARPGESVILEAVWSLRNRAGITLNRHTLLQARPAGPGLEPIVAAQSRVVTELAREIARQIQARAGNAK